MPAASLAQSHDHCHRVMRTAARNFYYGMNLLPIPQRRGMFALYGFMRLIDDLADDGDAPAGDRVAALERCRADAHAAIAGGGVADHPIWPAFGDTVRRFTIPVKVFDDAIDGQLRDMRHTTYDTFADLYDYCYQVASTVGIASVHIWGFSDPAVPKRAEERGIAFQLTNILRDWREDAGRGRCYLPADELDRFAMSGWTPDLPPPARFGEFMAFQVARARDYYERSAPLEGLIGPAGRPTLRIMTDIYRRILDRIAAEPVAILTGRVRLSGLEKIRVMLRHAWRARFGGDSEKI